MAATAALVFQGHNHLRYLIVGDEAGGVATIPNDAGATPDLQTDTLGGPLKQIARARLDGIGTHAPGVLTQAQARAILLGDGTSSVGNDKVPRAICAYTPRTTAAATVPAAVDANVDGGGDPILTVTIGVDSDGYLDIHFVGGIGTT